MLRALLCSVALLAFVTAGAIGQAQKDKTTAKGEKTKTEAKITKVDAKKGTITVQMKDKNGKQTEKTFTLTEDVRMLDSTGRVAAIDVFRSGDEVLVIEQEGRLKELHKHKTGAKSNEKDK